MPVSTEKGRHPNRRAVAGDCGCLPVSPEQVDDGETAADDAPTGRGPNNHFSLAEARFNASRDDVPAGDRENQGAAGINRVPMILRLN